MRYENVDKANKYKKEIETLELEIKEIQWLIDAERPNLDWLFKRFFRGEPKEKTYKKFYCSRGLDLIDSVVLINQREAQAVVNVKMAEIEEFKKMIEDLE